VDLEVDPAAAGEGVEALAVDLAAEAPALVAVRVDLEAAEVQVVRVAAVRLAAEARLPSLANGRRPRPLSVAESWEEFRACPECPGHPVQAG
jgi:hypothetical protein